jgi:hypothetical protein
MSIRQLVNIIYAILIRPLDSDARAELDAALDDTLDGRNAKKAARDQHIMSLGAPIRIGSGD